MKIIGITQARMGSTRLPGKVAMEVKGISLLEIHIKRLLKSKRIDHLVIATTTSSMDDGIMQMASKLGVDCYRGSEDDVLDRYYKAALKHESDYVVRVTSDCPLIDPNLVDEIIEYTIKHNADYGTNTLVESFPDGEDVEIFTFKTLETAWRDAKLLSEREHVTPYITANSDWFNKTLFKAINFKSDRYYGDIRMTVDYKEDFELISYLIEKVGMDKSWEEYVRLIKSENLYNINAKNERNSGYKASLKKEQK